MTRTPERILLGTCGRSYEHWDGSFYPPKLPADERLHHYAAHFPSVEINNSFYHLPEAGTLRQWYADVPADFVFSAKGSRYITHLKKLNNAADSITALLKRLGVLADKLGPILFQLPPRWRCNVPRLGAFLDRLSGEFRYAFEFRDPSWLNEEVYALLARAAVAASSATDIARLTGRLTGSRRPFAVGRHPAMGSVIFNVEMVFPMERLQILERILAVGDDIQDLPTEFGIRIVVLSPVQPGPARVLPPLGRILLRHYPGFFPHGLHKFCIDRHRRSPRNKFFFSLLPNNIAICG